MERKTRKLVDYWLRFNAISLLSSEYEDLILLITEPDTFTACMEQNEKKEAEAEHKAKMLVESGALDVELV